MFCNEEDYPEFLMFDYEDFPQILFMYNNEDDSQDNNREKNYLKHNDWYVIKK